MIKFFRKIRQRLLTENKFSKYLIYAIGEIILVVIGILIALQVNNWNEGRIKDKKFEGLLEQIYKSIYVEKEWKRTYVSEINAQLIIIDQILEKDSLEIIQKKLIHILFYLDIIPNEITSDAKKLIQYLDYNSNNEKTLLLTKELATYNSAVYGKFSRGYQSDITLTITNQLMKLDLPRPHVSFTLSSLNSFANIDTTYFNDHDIQIAKKLIKTKKFEVALKSLKSSKIQMLIGLNDGLNQSISFLQLIKDEYPKIRLQYNNIGIVGTALEFGWEKSIPMKLIDSKNAIWELDIYLKNGLIKFRDLNNWQHNWGGNKILKNETKYFGDNISVKEGNYRIILNLSENTYKFIKQEDQALQE